MQRLLVIAFLFTSLALQGSEHSRRRQSTVHAAQVNPSRLPHQFHPLSRSSNRWRTRDGDTRRKRNILLAALAMQGNLMLLEEQRQLNASRYN